MKINSDFTSFKCRAVISGNLLSLNKWSQIACLAQRTLILILSKNKPTIDKKPPYLYVSFALKQNCLICHSVKNHNIWIRFAKDYHADWFITDFLWKKTQIQKSSSHFFEVSAAIRNWKRVSLTQIFFTKKTARIQQSQPGRARIYDKYWPISYFYVGLGHAPPGFFFGF